MPRDRRDGMIHALWDELARFPMADAEVACRHLMQTLAAWLKADNAAWVGTARLLDGKQAARDPMCGWRSRTVMFLNPPGEAEALLAKRGLADHRTEFGLTLIATSRLAGRFRVHRLRDGFVDMAAFRKTLHYQAFYRDLGVDDRLWIGTPLTPQVESFFVFDRRNTRTRFSAAEVRLAGDTLRGLARLQRQLMYGHGLALIESPLTAMEQRVVHLLLSDKSEKEIAAALKQSVHTTHTHIKQVYRKYGAKGRAGLMAIWLSRW
ncbi:MAG: helix-turn-helix transcriptional regulator [Alphaproteobacteria bacterium]|nr:helix-turn-helix transcriptional regulator [Alphaproteobacteria bacterium]